MSIIHRFRSGGAPSHPYEGASHAPLRLDMEAAAIDGEALRSEINEFLANAMAASSSCSSGAIIPSCSRRPIS
jgi:hypothetical protein